MPRKPTKRQSYCCDEQYQKLEEHFYDKHLRRVRYCSSIELRDTSRNVIRDIYAEIYRSLKYAGYLEVSFKKFIQLFKARVVAVDHKRTDPHYYLNGLPNAVHREEQEVKCKMAKAKVERKRKRI